jgi:hypothetical protein
MAKSANPSSLIPPLLECLKHSPELASPPANLAQLVTPILRQRLSLWEPESWLHLLNWNKDLAEKLPDAVQAANLDLDYQDRDVVLYRRVDPESLLARIKASQYGLLPTYLWCMDSESNASRGSWKLQELRCLEDEDNARLWSESISEAETTQSSMEHATRGQKVTRGSASSTSKPYDSNSTNQTDDDDDDDDDSYWNQYDMTPGQSASRTPPTKKASPAPSFLRGGVPNRAVSRSSTARGAAGEKEYFDRYLDVQPALDPYDPQEDHQMPSSFTRQPEIDYESQRRQDETPMPPLGLGSPQVNGHLDVPDGSELHQPRARSSSDSSSVERLEGRAEGQAHAEMGIKQHISTDIKSLFRLARSAGISRQEFVGIVNRELEVLPLLDMD